MNDTSCNELKSILDAYLTRAERSSLMPLSTNLPGNTGAKIGSALQSARDLVNMFCAKKETTEFENLSLAFRCLYMGIINHQDKVTLVKQHQHYVVFLNTKMLHKLALEELSIIYNVLTSGILSNIPSHGTLLKGVSPEVDFSLPLVTSFHFFVIQSMLQMISSKVQSIVKKSSSSDPSLLWKVACFFLGGSNFDSCLSLCAVSSSRKYHLNGLKMLSGFLKVAEFIGARSSNSQVHLATSALKLKVIQYQVYTDSKIVFELPQINDSLLIPFVRDLHDTLSKTSGSTNFPILEALKHTHSLYLNLTDKTTSPKSAHAPELQKSPNSKNETRRNLAPLKFDHTNHKMVKNFLLSSNPSFDTVSGICLILEAIPNKNLRKSHFLVLESCVAFLKSALANETIFLQCLKILIPVLSSILIREKEVDIIQDLSILCFKFSRTYESIDGFHEVFQLDLAALCLCRNTETECHLKTRI
ncbi:hypothetical protein JCM33374_g156 [Metschnikowia sp. JCM 33374]|nr:hypothetical protein JCM33374_g156 [Metschnikowia sp. JCM 33374]